jgi:iron(III) transport system ATP-binding protein
MDPILTLEGVTKRYDNKTVVRDVSLTLEKGTVACLLGPSGSGKTTLLRSIAGFEALHGGSIILHGRTVSDTSLSVPPEERKIGMVFQDYGLFPHLTVERNIAFGLNGSDPADKQKRVTELLERTSLADHAKAYPHEISGGQQQRVALARSLAPEPELILLDEPFSNLDVTLRERLSREVREIIKESGATALMVTHNQLEAFAMADEIGVMIDGAMQQWGTAHTLYHRPANRSIARFVGDGVLLPGIVTGVDTVDSPLGTLSAHMTSSFADGTPVDVLIRPEDIVHDDDSPCRVRIAERTYRGPNIMFTLELETGEQVLSLVPSHHDHAVGEHLGIRVEVEELVVFERLGEGRRQEGGATN